MSDNENMMSRVIRKVIELNHITDHITDSIARILIRAEDEMSRSLLMDHIVHDITRILIRAKEEMSLRIFDISRRMIPGAVSEIRHFFKLNITAGRRYLSSHPVLYWILLFTPVALALDCIGLGFLTCNIVCKIKRMYGAARYRIAVELDQPRPIERCFTFARYSRTPNLKGLKGIADTVVGTSRADAPSSRLIVDDPSGLS